LDPQFQVLDESIVSSSGADAAAGSKRIRTPSPHRSRSPPNRSNIVPETHTNIVGDSFVHNSINADAAASGASQDPRAVDNASDDPDDAACPEDAIPVDWLPGVFIRFLPPPRLPSPPRIISPPPNSEWRSPSPPRRVNWWSFFHHRN
jgi:hypothetical protein